MLVKSIEKCEPSNSGTILRTSEQHGTRCDRQSVSQGVNMRQGCSNSGSDAVWSRSLTAFEMTENFNVQFRGLTEKSFSSRSILYGNCTTPELCCSDSGTMARFARVVVSDFPHQLQFCRVGPTKVVDFTTEGAINSVV